MFKQLLLIGAILLPLTAQADEFAACRDQHYAAMYPMCRFEYTPAGRNSADCYIFAQAYYRRQLGNHNDALAKKASDAAVAAMVKQCEPA
jgi:hypothetical protein